MKNWSRGKRIGFGVLAVWLLGIVVFAAVFGVKGNKAPSVASGEYTPVNAFKLDTWFSIGPINFNKGVLYIILTCIITCGVMYYISKRMLAKPARAQVALETVYNLTQSMSRDNMDRDLVKRYVPFICTLFVFILVTNLLGYIPLPVNTAEKFSLFGVMWPSFQLYAADTNVAFPLILALVVFILFNIEGVRHHGPGGYMKSLIPAGVTGGMLVMIFPLEIVSTFLRLISLTVRLWANLLAGHLLISFMGGELGVLLGLPVVSWFTLPAGIAIFVFEAVLIAGLQAFIFAILTAIYIGSSARSH